MVIRKKLSIVIMAAVFVLAHAGASLAQTTWTKHAGNPVLKVGEAGQWDSKYVEPRTVVFHDAAYHLWYDGFDGAYWQIGYATSPDGIIWTKYPDNPVFVKGPAGTWDDYAVYGPSVIHDGEKFHMWYSGFGAATQIGHATSDDGIAWTRDPANPVVESGLGALAFDRNGAQSPSVVFAEGKYKMWYTGIYASVTATIGYAESSDGTVWTKSADNPVLGLAEQGAWDDTQLVSPCVVFDGSTYHLWYTGWRVEFRLLKWGFNKIGYAASADGLSWTRHEDNPVLKPVPRLFFGWDGRGVSDPVVILDGSQFKMWYAGFGGWGKAYHRQIGFATSPADTQ